MKIYDNIIGKTNADFVYKVLKRNNFYLVLKLKNKSFL